MCMKFVNAVISCYESVSTTDTKSIQSFNAPIDVITCSNLDVSTPIVTNLFMVTHISVRGTLKEADIPQNILCKDGSIDVILRLTKCDADESKRLYVDLDKFTINLAEERQKGNIKHACFDYYNHVHVSNITEFQLPAGTGNYVLKVLMCESGTDAFSIQSMSGLKFKIKEDNCE